MLKVLENGIVPIYQGENGQVANARELHEFLEVGTKFADWIKGRIKKYGFVENEDFIHVSEKRETPTGTTIAEEYILTLDTAKELAMVQNNPKGRQIRKYFIEVEKRHRDFNVNEIEKGSSTSTQSYFYNFSKKLREEMAIEIASNSYQLYLEAERANKKYAKSMELLNEVQWTLK